MDDFIVENHFDKKETKRNQSSLEVVLERQIIQFGLPVPKRNFRFHPKRRLEFDFAWEQYRVAAEVQGGIWMRKGAHSRPANIERDAEKLNEAHLNDWMLLFIPGSMLKDSKGITYIMDALRKRGWPG